MIDFLGNIMGSILRYVYTFVSSVLPSEPSIISYYAISIIITSVIFKLILLPLSLNQVKSSRKMSELQPLIKDIQTKYKNDPKTMQIKMQELYKEHKYNPASGCLVLIIQMPIILAFFAVFRDPSMYAFTDPEMYQSMAKNFFWIKDLGLQDPYLWGLPLLAGITTYLQSVTMMSANPNADPSTQSTQRIMNIVLPFMIFFAARGFAAGLALYWVISNIFSIVQQLIVNRSVKKSVEAK
ncbi:MAG: membrane protein insertase YidC [Tissierellales bacterium]|nr:membrane protein insertase YidC [Tissierellales bacterium]